MLFKVAALLLVASFTLPRSTDATGSNPTRSPVNCNDVIKEDETLTKNLNCDCSHEPALAVTKGANLDLAGYKVSCSKGPGTCVEIDDEHSLVKNGKLSDCKTGVVVKGVSGKVSYLEIEHVSDGIVVEEHAMDNDILDNTIKFSDDDGIVVYGKENEIKRNTIVEPDDKAILVKGEGNLVKENKVKDAGGWGIYVDGRTVGVVNNEIRGTNEKDGIKFTSHALYGIVKENHVYDAADDGIDVQADGTLIDENMVTGSDGDGIDVDADEVQVLSNTISNSGENGIEAHGDHVKVDHNTVESSGENGIQMFGDEAKVCFNDVSYSHENGILFGGDDSVLDENKVTESEHNGIQIGSDEDGFADDKDNKIYLNEIKASHKDDIFLGEDTEDNEVFDNTVEDSIVEVSNECQDDHPNDADECCNKYKRNSVEEVCGGGEEGDDDDDH